MTTKTMRIEILKIFPNKQSNFVNLFVRKLYVEFKKHAKYRSWKKSTKTLESPTEISKVLEESKALLSVEMK